LDESTDKTIPFFGDLPALMGNFKFKLFYRRHFKENIARHSSPAVCLWEERERISCIFTPNGAGGGRLAAHSSKKLRAVFEWTCTIPILFCKKIHRNAAMFYIL